MPTIVGILTLISTMNTASERHNVRNVFSCWYSSWNFVLSWVGLPRARSRNCFSTNITTVDVLKFQTLLPTNLDNKQFTYMNNVVVLDVVSETPPHQHEQCGSARRGLRLRPVNTNNVVVLYVVSNALPVIMNNVVVLDVVLGSAPSAWTIW